MMKMKRKKTMTIATMIIMPNTVIQTTVMM